jgi:DNA invertase Pin-like site-specific DNA recombinase
MNKRLPFRTGSITSWYPNKQEAKMTKAAIYARCSTNDQFPENQIIALKQLAQKNNDDVLFEFVDNGQSGIKRDREQLNVMLSTANKKKFTTLYVAGIDRLSRSVKDLIEVVDKLNGLGIRIVFMRESIDTETATGRFFLTVLGSLYQMEREIMIERINAGIHRAKSQGKHCGRPSKINSSLISSVKLLRDKGVSIRDIAKTCGIGVGTTYKILSEEN